MTNALSFSTVYPPYGMVMPNRHGNAHYRYGFNGMEQDDEVKNLKGTSYDFGARMYDPRVGRWLSRDPLAYRQPSHSPYKANGNNPIIYNDPDGKQEIVRITIKNAVTGESTTLIMFPKSGKDKVAAGDFYTDGTGWDAGSTVQNFYDYVKDYTLSYNPNDGTMKLTYEGLTLVKGNGVQADDYIWGKVYKSGTIVKRGIFDKADDRKIPGGMYLTSKDGGADPTKYKSENNIPETLADDLISLLGGMKGKRNSDEYEKYKDFFDGVTKAKDLYDRTGESVSTDEIPGTNQTPSKYTTWAKEEDGKYHGTRGFATIEERMIGDTLVGDTPEKNRYINESGDTIQGSPPKY